MKIKKATILDAPVLEKVIIESFLVPHGHAAPKDYIDEYILRNFNKQKIKEEIEDVNNQIWVLEYEDKIVGFSKIMFNYKNDNIKYLNVTKMERIYLLKVYYGLGLGEKLFKFNAKLAQESHQKGMWLHVWTENHRAIKFYQKMGMNNVGYYDFPVSADHTNPNHVMYLEF